jgi:nitrite reductase/ring-hydroxylating ferredoxin subunit/DMSO/TMAO reductase YedYZ heme-binding membrane subunit
LIVVYLVVFVSIGKLRWRGDHAISDEILVLRDLGTCAFVMLNVTLCIGPLARLDRRFLPLLYNRRHLGVAAFLLGASHGLLSLGFYHGFGVISPLASLLTSNAQYRSISAFPFEILGAVALLILFLMAATSHDFWLKNLTPAMWKWLHMLVYAAWASLVLHVACGALRTERSMVYRAMLAATVIIVAGLHVAAGRRETRRDRGRAPDEDWIDVAAVESVKEGRGRVVCIGGRERVAIFKHEGRLSAVSNVCAHQGGPLGEGRIVAGCITCPWHGFQYRPGDGCAPPPFTEKIETFRLRVEDGRVFLHPMPLPPGTPVEPIACEPEALHV